MQIVPDIDKPLLQQIFISSVVLPMIVEDGHSILIYSRIEQRPVVLALLAKQLLVPPTGCSKMIAHEQRELRFCVCLLNTNTTRRRHAALSPSVRTRRSVLALHHGLHASERIRHAEYSISDAGVVDNRDHAGLVMVGCDNLIVGVQREWVQAHLLSTDASMGSAIH